MLFIEKYLSLSEIYANFLFVVSNTFCSLNVYKLNSENLNFLYISDLRISDNIWIHSLECEIHLII